MAKYILVLLLGVIFVWGQPKIITINKLKHQAKGNKTF